MSALFGLGLVGLAAAADGRLRRPAKLSAFQRNVLAYLVEHGATGSVKLGYATGAGESTLRSLGERGLIERVRGPAGDAYYDVTADGRAALAASR